MDAISGLRRADVDGIPFDDIDVNAAGYGTHTVGDQAGVLRWLLNVVDLQDAAVGIEVLPHGGGRVRLEKHAISGPAVAQLGISLDVIVTGWQTSHPQGVTSLQGHTRRIHPQTGRGLDVDVQGAALLYAPVGHLAEEEEEENIRWWLVELI